MLSWLKVLFRPSEQRRAISPLTWEKLIAIPKDQRGNILLNESLSLMLDKLIELDKR